jgi:acetoin utilization deacetylase AcuC-like enzyme
MKLVWSPRYEVDIGAHVFPTRKYRLVKDRLVEDGTLEASDLVHPEPASETDLGRVHTADYLRKIREDGFTRSERIRLEVPFSAGFRESMVLCCGGTIECGRRALDDGLCVHLGGGFHHAFPDHGEGFCLLNDVAVAARALLADGSATRVAVVDLDVHHGNGTAAIFVDEPAVFTFSMHQENNYPALKPPGDLDVALPDRLGDEEYLEQLERHLPAVLDAQEPRLVFYLAGADPYREDQLGGLGLTIGGLRRRDRTVLETCRERGAALAVVPAGGYAIDTADTVEIHCNTVREAKSLVSGTPR